MKIFFRKIRWRARIIISQFKKYIYGTKIISVTGSSAKSTTSLLIGSVLEESGNVEISARKDNTLRRILKNFRNIGKSTKYFVSEIAISRHGHIKEAAGLLRPDVVVVTFIGIEHHSIYKSREAIADEKGALVEHTRPNGIVLLNADDDLVMKMADRTAERITTYGKDREADYRAVELGQAENGTLALTIEWKGGPTDISTQFFGEQFWLSTTAAFATAVELGVDPSAAAKRIASFSPAPMRGQMLETRNGPKFLLDTIKAPKHTLINSFEMIRTVPGGKKRIVLGQISDFPGNPKRVYRDAYRAARDCADQVIFVGDHAHRSMASAEDRETQRFMEFATPLEVFNYLQSSCTNDEVVLLKGSNNLHLERIAFAFNNEIACWEPACGVKLDCLECGLWGRPFSEHYGKDSKRR